MLRIWRQTITLCRQRRIRRRVFEQSLVRKRLTLTFSRWRSVCSNRLKAVSEEDETRSPEDHGPRELTGEDGGGAVQEQTVGSLAQAVFAGDVSSCGAAEQSPRCCGSAEQSPLRRLELGPERSFEARLRASIEGPPIRSGGARTCSEDGEQDSHAEHHPLSPPVRGPRYAPALHPPTEVASLQRRTAAGDRARASLSRQQSAESSIFALSKSSGWTGEPGLAASGECIIPGASTIVAGEPRPTEDTGGSGGGSGGAQEVRDSLMFSLSKSMNLAGDIKKWWGRIDPVEEDEMLLEDDLGDMGDEDVVDEEILFRPGSQEEFVGSSVRPEGSLESSGPSLIFAPHEPPDHSGRIAASADHPVSSAEPKTFPSKSVFSPTKTFVSNYSAVGESIGDVLQQTKRSIATLEADLLQEPGGRFADLLRPLMQSNDPGIMDRSGFNRSDSDLCNVELISEAPSSMRHERVPSLLSCSPDIKIVGRSKEEQGSTRVVVWSSSRSTFS